AELSSIALAKGSGEWNYLVGGHVHLAVLGGLRRPADIRLLEQAEPDSEVAGRGDSRQRPARVSD
ncbi:hypothetical protein, partial [Klebsiella aerogenes]|uniref:hypothetical protein n=1 Tax=Klebsiella aerogenes TaxID=548 RepID=UPI001952F85A